MNRVINTKVFSGIVLATATILGGCTNMEQMPGPGHGGQGGACTREYAPVCGAKGYKRKTFSNACTANAKGFSVIKEGRCIG